MKVTYGDVKTRLANVSAGGICPTDTRLIDRVNEAIQRLMIRGKWLGTIQRYKFCVYHCCLTLPRWVETILAANVCGAPHRIRNQWYEFMGNGPGSVGCCGCSFIDRGDGYSTFHDICGLTKKLRVYADVPEAAGARILIKGIDENGNTIMTLDGSTWIEGEYILIDNATPQLSTKLFTQITGIVKPVTNGFIRIYEYNTTDAVQSIIVLLEPGEKVPSYRRYVVPGTSDDVTNPSCVEAIVKRRFVPIATDNDELIISNIGALKLMLLALEKEERNFLAEAMAYEEKAVKILSDELTESLGDSSTGQIQVQMHAFGGADVCAVI